MRSRAFAICIVLAVVLVAGLFSASPALAHKSSDAPAKIKERDKSTKVERKCMKLKMELRSNVQRKLTKAETNEQRDAIKEKAKKKMAKLEMKCTKKMSKAVKKSDKKKDTD